MAIGDVFKVQVEVQGYDPGERITVRVNLGPTTLSLPMQRVTPDNTKDRTGPWLYESAAIEIFVSAAPHAEQNIVVEYTQASSNTPVQGITGLALNSLIEDYLDRIGRARHPLEILVLLEKLAALVTLADDPALYQYTALKLQSFAQRSPMADLLQENAAEYRSAAFSILNQRLYEQLDGIIPQTLDDPGPTNTSERNVLRALVLLKDTGLARGTERLMELNRWKRGSGIVSRDSLLTYPPQEIITRLRGMKNADEAKNFLVISGIANAEAQLRSMRNAAIQYARGHGQELQNVWAQMLEARKWYQWASRQFDIVFDWEPARHRYAEQYLVAERQYHELLQEYDLLKTMINDARGDQQPLWQAILPSQDESQIQRYFDQAVDNSEQAVRDMMSNLVQMRTMKSLIDLGGQKYKELHAMAQSFGAPNAVTLVNLAKGMQEQVAAESYWEKAAWDFGLGVVQIGGTLFPPVFYTATVIQIGRRGNDVITAYAERVEAETTEAAGVGSTLETDNARRNLQRSIGDLALESVFGVADAAMIKTFRAAARAERSAANAMSDIAKLQEIGDGIKQRWAAQHRFQRQIAELENSVQRAEEMAVKKRAKIADWDRKIKNALEEGNEPLRDQRMAKRADDQRTLVQWRELASRKTSELRALQQAGPRMPNPRLHGAIQGTDVERATRQFYEKLSQNPERTFVDKLGANRYQLGEIIPGSVNGKVRRRFEVRLNGTITDAQGRTIRPPERVKLPNEIEPVINPFADRESMIFDRIIIDQKENIIYLDDLIRTGNREHFIKTHSYTTGLEQMFPGYRVAGVERKGVGEWPRDIVWGNMSSPISALSADLRPYVVHHGVSQPAPGH
jgi:hypothetical protein